MILRRYNGHGIGQFAHYLTRLRLDPATPPPSELIDDPRYSEIVHPIVDVERPPFATKYDAGDYLREKLSAVPMSVLRADVQIWAWLAFWFFDQLCPADVHGRRRPLKQNAKYIALAGDHRYGLDKHLVFFPWKMVSAHGSIARFFLADGYGEDPRAQREWTSTNINVSTPIVELGTRLYGNAESGALKRGAVSDKRRGNLRRFVQVMSQLKVTFDIHGMSADQLTGLLPRRDYGKWIQ